MDWACEPATWTGREEVRWTHRGTATFCKWRSRRGGKGKQRNGRDKKMERRAANLLVLIGAFGFSNCLAREECAETKQSEVLEIVLPFLFPKAWCR